MAKRQDDGAQTSGLPIWAAAFPIVAALHLLKKAGERELFLRVWLMNPNQAVQPWYADHAALTRFHLVTGALLTVLGFLQFIPVLRTKYPVVHRWNGRAIIAVGGVAAVTGIWMNLVFPMGGILKYLGGYFFGVMVLMGVALGFRAIRRGDVATHRAWMSRAFAVAIAAGVQRLLMEVWLNMTGTMSATAIGVCLWSGAFIALSVNELLLRRAQRSAYP